VDLNIDAEPVKLTVNQAIPCGLILNEIVTNAYKHAFAGRETGTIDIKLKQDGDDITLKIKDDGAGLPGDVEFDNPHSLGLKLIDTLSKQLSGTAEFRNANPGTEFILQFEFEE
jgi:two-component sensor histidine kinase